MLMVLTSVVMVVITANCGVPLGLETGAIPDSDITASSAYDSGIVGPQHGRSVHYLVQQNTLPLGKACLFTLLGSSEVGKKRRPIVSSCVCPCRRGETVSLSMSLYVSAASNGVFILPPDGI
jgi:hypothetical protein